MKYDYVHFGDVVSFDTTYKKNKEGPPFAFFVGVNHHKQTIIFGAALLYDETASTFVWLFDTFAKAMRGKLPITILTDQDAAMAKALASHWPETYHRLCIWHIYQNAAVHLSSVFGRFPRFLSEFSSCVYDYDEEDEFLDAWNKMLEKYGLQTNQWLKRLFNIREKWALVNNELLMQKMDDVIPSSYTAHSTWDNSRISTLQVSQKGRICLSSSNTIHPTQGSSFSNFQPFQFTQVSNPNVTATDSYSRNDKESEMSLTQLLKSREMGGTSLD